MIALLSKRTPVSSAISSIALCSAELNVSRVTSQMTTAPERSIRSTVADSSGISPVRISRIVPAAPPREIASVSSAASSSPRPAFFPVARQ
ncbi:MAG: hypothetical protein DMF58_03505, partial [Acidobacteria bacterium]